ncbi:cellulase N-terminal Ig-like domain-containing protein [Streptomyces flaveolus]|uniref:Cellulase N-terminal Ig-like domain-containing protein n=1 Tax=Streptomyces flaveolus TaxID=67297 RepID=A0ABV1VBP6_9ACTN
MAIRVNQVGQVPGEKKFAHVMGDRDTLADAEFEVLDERGERRARRQALRRVKTSEATPRTPHVLRFLAEHSGNLYHLVGEVTAPWEHSGQRVLFLEEAADYWRWTMSGVRRSRSRRKKETEPAAPAGADHQHAVGLAGRPPAS